MNQDNCTITSGTEGELMIMIDATPPLTISFGDHRRPIQKPKKGHLRAKFGESGRKHWQKGKRR